MVEILIAYFIRYVTNIVTFWINYNVYYIFFLLEYITLLQSNTYKGIHKFH